MKERGPRGSLRPGAFEGEDGPAGNLAPRRPLPSSPHGNRQGSEEMEMKLLKVHEEASSGLTPLVSVGGREEWKAFQLLSSPLSFGERISYTSKSA
ncbi:hypothetical protein D3C76_1409290 [compost metagenome]